MTRGTAGGSTGSPDRAITPAAFDRDQVITDFGRVVYGVTPALQVSVDSTDLAQQVMYGTGAENRIRLTVTGPRGAYSFELALCLPNTDRSPVFLGLNFDGNDAALQQWPIDLLLRRGYGVATAHASAIEPDRLGGAADGIRTVLPEGLDDWGTLGVWAWALSLIRRQLPSFAHVQADKIIAIGHSRMGKAALWAAAQDTGFAAVVSNEAGCSGDALHRHLSTGSGHRPSTGSRHRVKEDIAAITGKFPYWFTPSYAGYAGRDAELPVDQDQLLASIAPRPVCVGSASEDDWADPLGQFQAVLAARELNEGSGPVGFHLRPGDHALLAEDWLHYLAFLDRHLSPGSHSSS
ncbi:glucuronyl esterase domain-containing protein [Microlunatus soli]|uniref:4-O-methyl-glucuronoyl methylesterase-like domain-containing protein n=1 Tax=Microlunatus soli TaxID=630515 RepID=A0A1H1PVU3_9ACTN|nr:hypothetical protein [Microlunatus soli]SDS15216.1 hypothetical protein SAMN04489812_1041 [Microlunatus soli]